MLVPIHMYAYTSITTVKMFLNQDFWHWIELQMFISIIAEF